MSAGDKYYLADKGTLDELKSQQGNSNDTGGSSTTGTVMGKLNALITSLSTHMGRWTAARATKVDTIDTNVSGVKSTASTISANVTSVKTSVGVTTDTGGSATAGTLMGKTNAILTALGNLEEALNSL